MHWYRNAVNEEFQVRKFFKSMGYLRMHSDNIWQNLSWINMIDKGNG